MIHGPCSPYNLLLPCMEGGNALKVLTQELLKETQHNNVGYSVFKYSVYSFYFRRCKQVLLSEFMEVWKKQLVFAVFFSIIKIIHVHIYVESFSSVWAIFVYIYKFKTKGAIGPYLILYIQEIANICLMYIVQTSR